MKIVIRTVFFHFFCIVLFSYLYLYLSNDFQNIKEVHIKYSDYIDFLLLSTTIQAGVGITNITPITFNSKLAITIQQVFVILTHVITLYVFTL